MFLGWCFKKTFLMGLEQHEFTACNKSAICIWMNLKNERSNINRILNSWKSGKPLYWLLVDLGVHQVPSLIHFIDSIHVYAYCIAIPLAKHFVNNESS